MPLLPFPLDSFCPKCSQLIGEVSRTKSKFSRSAMAWADIEAETGLDESYIIVDNHTRNRWRWVIVWKKKSAAKPRKKK